MRLPVAVLRLLDEIGDAVIDAAEELGTGRVISAAPGRLQRRAGANGELVGKTCWLEAVEDHIAAEDSSDDDGANKPDDGDES